MLTTYDRRKAAGLCGLCGTRPPHAEYVYCDPCRLREALRKDAHLTVDEWHRREALRCQAPFVSRLLSPLPSALHGPAVGHCGQWWPCTTLPVRCGTCGAVVLEERG